MIEDTYITLIMVLMPIAAGMVIFQTNPYHALVIRGILGGVASLVYAVLGAADVALTEALVGTMLAIALYAVAVRSSLVMRLGILSEPSTESSAEFQQLMQALRQTLGKYQVRIELVQYGDRPSLHKALIDKEIHSLCLPSSPKENLPPYHTTTRIHRLHEILTTELSSPLTTVTLPNPHYSKEPQP